MAAKELLAEAFYKGKKFSAIVMIAEDIQDTNEMPFKLKVWYTKALVKEKNLRLAQEMYEEILDDSPRFSDPELDEALRIKAFSDLEELDLDKELFLEESNISFKDVGGLADVKKEINLKIIKPLLNPDLYKMYGKKVGGGILLYGPPGCGKTYMARATAGEIDAKFINVGINDILDMYIGQSERNLADVFEVAREHTPCVLFFDEVDAIGASRHQMINQAGKNVINQFLSEMDGISSDNEGLLIVGATNTPWALDTAFRRPGRFDRIIFVPPPDNDARAAIFELALREKPLGEGINYAKLAKSTDMFSGADIYSVVDRAIEAKLEIALETGEVQPIEMTDLQQAIKKTKPSTMEWFNTAKNYALYANQSGLYDEILKYIK
jgi:SpoVK/Ycf46/Vps4 family AAA+-type ATPase